VRFRPDLQRPQRFVQGAAEFGELVAGVAVGVVGAVDHAIAFQRSQRVGEHFLGDPAHLPVQLAEPEGAVGQQDDDHRGPLVREARQ